MTKPILMAVHEHPRELATIQRELLGRYAADYEVIAEASASAAPERAGSPACNSTESWESPPAGLLQKPCISPPKRRDQEWLERAVRRIEMSLRPSKSPISEACQFAECCTSKPRLKQFEKHRYDRSRGFRREAASLPRGTI